MIAELIKKLDDALLIIEELRFEVKELQTENFNLKIRLAITEEKLAITEEKLKVTEEKLAITEERLAITEEKLKVAEEKLNQNSNNSHLPPSKDHKNTIKPALPKSNKKNGGQKDHKGNTLKMVENPDETVILRPNFCTCGQDLSGIEGEISGKRQVFDLPIQKLDVTEYQTIKVTCTCGLSSCGKFPNDVSAPVQYGPGVQSACILYSTIGIPLNKIGFIFESQFGQKINDSTILKLINSEAIQLAYENIYENLANESVLCLDETGIHIPSEKTWCHVISTPNLTYLYSSPKRGQLAFDNVPFLKEYNKWVVHDSYASYNNLLFAKHGLCNAHICRELIALIENDKRIWAKEMLELLYRIYEETDKGHELYTDFEELDNSYDEIIQKAELEEPLKVKTNKKGRAKGTKGRNLLERLKTNKEPILAFAKYREVPFTNNLAERDFRPIKVKNKIAGYFKTNSSLNAFLKNLSVFKTLVKNKLNPFLQIRDLIYYFNLNLS